MATEAFNMNNIQLARIRLTISGKPFYKFNVTLFLNTITPILKIIDAV